MMNPLDQFSPAVLSFLLYYREVQDEFQCWPVFQLPSYTMLGFRASDGKLLNKANGITYIQADHLVAA